MIKAAFKRQQAHFIAGVARALGENNQRIALPQSLAHLRNHLLRIAALAINQQAAKHFFNHKAAQAPAQPIIRSRHRPRMNAPALGQRNPHQHKITVAVVVGIIHRALARAIELLRLLGAHAGDKRSGRTQHTIDDARQHACEHFPAHRPFPFFIVQLYLKACSQGRLKKFQTAFCHLCTLISLSIIIYHRRHTFRPKAA